MTPEQERALLDNINLASFYSKRYLDERIQAVRAAEEDGKKEQRLVARRCVFCYYLRRNVMAGQAFTQSFCGGCRETTTFATTDVDQYCAPCADRYGLCVYCGGDRELKTRRTKLVRK